jgi:hypothetical protein
MPKPFTATVPQAVDHLGSSEDRRAAALSERNNAVQWDQFDSEWYSRHHYDRLLPDDIAIVEKVRDYFAAAGVRRAAGIDVGPGPNIYPSLAMLPFCASLDLWEFSGSNVTWLTNEIHGYNARWDKFWELYRQAPEYRSLADPRRRLADIATVKQASVFDLPKNRWGIGTMFFVACSISTDLDEFQLAVRCFVESLVPGAPFATAFMVNSREYRVNKETFPAVPIDEEAVHDVLKPLAVDVGVHKVFTRHFSRLEYDGMIIATGRRRAKTG